jgi:hypothetical protein
VIVHPHLSAVLTTLQDARREMQHAVERLEPSRGTVKPAPERWCAAEVLEPLALAEGSFSVRMAAAIDAARVNGATPASAAEPEPLQEAIRTRLADRSTRRMAPERAQPTGGLDVATAWTHVDDVERRVRQMLADAGGLPLHDIIVEHPTLGSFTVYQFVELMAAHRRRHVAQLHEIADAVGGDGAGQLGPVGGPAT